jgi:adenosylcobinamide kinase/adenosylcobinamide-phosphate guanylyltransferase
VPASLPDRFFESRLIRKAESVLTNFYETDIGYPKIIYSGLTIRISPKKYSITQEIYDHNDCSIETMARIILVTGGARSGKSQYAESFYAPEEDVVYIATSKIFDEEMRERVRLHQLSRPATWITFEGSYKLYKAMSETRHYLLDCISGLTSNIMFDLTSTYEKIPMDIQHQVERTVVNEIETLIKKIEKLDGTLVLVTNEVGSAIVPENHVARVYRDILGKVNQRVASLCHEVYLVVCGIPLKLK